MTGNGSKRRPAQTTPDRSAVLDRLDEILKSVHAGPGGNEMRANRDFRGALPGPGSTAGSPGESTLPGSPQVAIVVLDEERQVTQANVAALALLALDTEPGTGAGVPLAELAGRAPTALTEAVREFVNHGRPVTAEQVRLPDGTVLEAEYRPITIDGAVRSHVVVAQDVTGRGALRRVLEARRCELDELAELKSDFVATIAHELRTPLTAVSSLLELVETPGRHSPAHTPLAAARRNIERLRAVTEDLLTLAGLETEDVDLDRRPVDITALVTELTPSAVLSLHQHIPVFVSGDRGWLARMIRCLFAGARAATDTTLAVRSTADDRRWVMVVSGLRAATGDERASVGLDLATAEAIAKRHGGELRRAGRGTALLLSLPLRLPKGT
jgi:signal transduction histidine kinase